MYAGCVVQCYGVVVSSHDLSTGVSAGADNTLIPPEVQEAFERVRSGADFMPTQQMEVRSSISLHKQCPYSCRRRGFTAAWCSLANRLCKLCMYRHVHLLVGTWVSRGLVAGWNSCCR